MSGVNQFPTYPFPNYAELFKSLVPKTPLFLGYVTQNTAQTSENQVSLPTALPYSISGGINAGFQALSSIGTLVGGTAGTVMQGASNLGSTIKGVVDASKAADGFKNMSASAKGGSIGAVVGAASDLIGSFMPEKTEYSGDKGNITQTMDSVYDGIADAAMAIPGWGTLVGGIMKGGKVLGLGVNALGGGTDGMCVCAGTKVFTANGNSINIEDLCKEDGIIGWDIDNKQTAPLLIHNFITLSKKDCVEITLINGISLKCSYDHPIFNGKEFIPAHELTINDFVAISDYPASTNNIYLVKVKSKMPIGILIVYNLQADYNHTYLANNIITHNTTTDAILGSAFFNLTPLGLINGFGGAKTNTMTKDTEVFEQIGSSYTGSADTIDSAVQKSGKKYGLFSRKAMHDANNEIAEARRQQDIMTEIADESRDRMTLKTSMSAINGNRRLLSMQGGYDQAAVRAGKYGMSIELLQRARNILKALKGTKLIDPYLVYFKSLPKNQQDSTNYRVKDYWEFNGRPKDFEEAKRKGMFVELEDFDNSGKSLGKFWHGFTVSENPNTGQLEFMKSSTHPTILKELDWYNSDDGARFRSLYELIKTEPYYKYVKRKTPVKQETPLHKNGGSIIKLISETTINLVNPLDVPEFLNGGSINVIPDGALHARKHNMEDADNLTKKGIPVVDNKGELQAEIEKEEVILRLEVTLKLEELEKKYSNGESSQKEKDEYALEAGKLIIDELLHNTKDNAGLL